GPVSARRAERRARWPAPPPSARARAGTLFSSPHIIARHLKDLTEVSRRRSIAVEAKTLLKVSKVYGASRSSAMAPLHGRGWNRVHHDDGGIRAVNTAASRSRSDSAHGYRDRQRPRHRRANRDGRGACARPAAGTRQPAARADRRDRRLPPDRSAGRD